MTLTESVLEDEGMHVFEWWGGEYRNTKVKQADFFCILVVAFHNIS